MIKILCPIDFSEASKNAAGHAGQIARHTEASIDLLTIVEAPTLSDIANVNAGFNPGIEQRMEEAKAKLDAYSVSMEAEFGISCRSHVRSHLSSVDEALEREILNGKFDMVVMGTNGADDFWQFYFGTHSYRVIRKAASPVLMIPENCRFTPYTHIVYATDYSPDDIRTIGNAYKFTRHYEPTFTLLHIDSTRTIVHGSELEEMIRSIITEVGAIPIKFEHIEAAKASTGIDRYMKKHNADLLVLLTKKYDLFERLFHRSVTKELSYFASYPVLIYHH